MCRNGDHRPLSFEIFALWPSVAITVNLIGNAIIDNVSNDGCSAGEWSFVTEDENTVRCVFLRALGTFLFKVDFLPTYDPQNATTTARDTDPLSVQSVKVNI